MNLMDKFHGSPLSFTAENAHEAVLVARGDFMLNSKAEFHGSVLWSAVKNGHLEVKLLVNTE